MLPQHQTARPDDRSASSDDSVIIPILEETARVTKRHVATGGARIHVTVCEHDESVEAMLLHQDVTIERVPIDIQIDVPPPTRREGETLVVPILEERLVVEKRLFLKEELRIRIDETRKPVTQAVRLRREQAEIVRDHLDEPTTEGTAYE